MEVIKDTMNTLRLFAFDDSLSTHWSELTSRIDLKLNAGDFDDSLLVAHSINIAKLSNLTTNGFVKTSGSDGTLSVDLNTYITGNEEITLSGDVSGSGTTTITATVADDSHNHIIGNVDDLQTALDEKLNASLFADSIEAAHEVNATKLKNLTDNGFVKTRYSDGSLYIDEVEYPAVETGDISSVTAGDGLGGGAETGDADVYLKVNANGGLEISSDSARIKLNGNSLILSSSGVKVNSVAGVVGAKEDSVTMTDLNAFMLDFHDIGGIDDDVPDTFTDINTGTGLQDSLNVMVHRKDTTSTVATNGHYYPYRRGVLDSTLLSTALQAEVDGSITNEIEVVNETYNSTNFNDDTADTTEAVSQNNFYDFNHTFDTDDDGLPNKVDLSSAGFVKTGADGVLTVDGSTYLTSEVDGSTTNEIEVDDETVFNSVNFDGKTAEATSKDDFYDHSHIADIDDDGLAAKIDTLASAGFVKTDATGNLSSDNSTYITGNQPITLSGDVDGTGTTSITTTVDDYSHRHLRSDVDTLLSSLDSCFKSVNFNTTLNTERTISTEWTFTDSIKLSGGIRFSTGATAGYFWKANDDYGNGVWAAVVASQVYKGTWDAHTNTPTLEDGTGTAGWFYRCVAGDTFDVGDRNVIFDVGDDISYNGTLWERIPAYSATPAALTDADDTNITLSLGGTPATALLQAVTITAGWTGTLADERIASAATWNAKMPGTLEKDITTSGTGLSGGADNVLPGVDADVQITLTTSGDILGGNGLTGEFNDVLPGNEADVSLSVNVHPDGGVELFDDSLKVKLNGLTLSVGTDGLSITSEGHSHSAGTLPSSTSYFGLLAQNTEVSDTLTLGKMSVVNDTALSANVTLDTEWDTATEINSRISGGPFLLTEVDGSVTNEIEVDDETVYNATNFNGKTTEGTSKDDFYDYQHVADTDDDALPNKVDLGSAGFVKTDASGVLSVDGSTYLTTEVDGSITNEIEVVDETYNASNFNAGTTSAVSQDDFYDYQHISDIDDDGAISKIDTLTSAGFVKTDAYGVLSSDNSAYLTSETGDISSVTAGPGLSGGGTTGAVAETLNVSANGGLEISSDSVKIKLNGSTLALTSAGIAVNNVSGITGANEDNVTLTDVQTATSSDFHSIGGTDDQTPSVDASSGLENYGTYPQDSVRIKLDGTTLSKSSSGLKVNAVTDTEVSNTLTIGSSSTVDDAAIPSGVTRDSEWNTQAEVESVWNTKLVNDGDTTSTTSADGHYYPYRRGINDSTRIDSIRQAIVPGGDVSGTIGSLVVTNDSHNHTSTTLPATTSYLGTSIDSTETGTGVIVGSGVSGYLTRFTGLETVDSCGVYWDSLNKRLGIGTVSPGEKLSVNGNIDLMNNSLLNTYILQGRSDTHLYLRPQGANAIRVNYNGGTGGVLFFNGVETEVASISSTGNVQADGTLHIDGTGISYIQGNVGIGTTNPTSPLTVLSQADNYGTGAGIKILASDFSTYGGYLYLNKNSGDNTHAVIQSGDASKLLSLALNPNGGNVGIGIATPLAQLHTTGTVRFAAAADTCGLWYGDADGDLTRIARPATAGWLYNPGSYSDSYVFSTPTAANVGAVAIGDSSHAGAAHYRSYYQALQDSIRLDSVLVRTSMRDSLQGAKIAARTIPALALPSTATIPDLWTFSNGLIASHATGSCLRLYSNTSSEGAGSVQYFTLKTNAGNDTNYATMAGYILDNEAGQVSGTLQFDRMRNGLNETGMKLDSSLQITSGIRLKVGAIPYTMIGEDSILASSIAKSAAPSWMNNDTILALVATDTLRLDSLLTRTVGGDSIIASKIQKSTAPSWMVGGDSYSLIAGVRDSVQIDTLMTFIHETKRDSLNGAKIAARTIKTISIDSTLWPNYKGLRDSTYSKTRRDSLFAITLRDSIRLDSLDLFKMPTKRDSLNGLKFAWRTIPTTRIDSTLWPYYRGIGDSTRLDSVLVRTSLCDSLQGAKIATRTIKTISIDSTLWPYYKGLRDSLYSKTRRDSLFNFVVRDSVRLDSLDLFKMPTKRDSLNGTKIAARTIASVALDSLFYPNYEGIRDSTAFADSCGVLRGLATWTVTATPGTNQTGSGYNVEMLVHETVGFGDACYMNSDGEMALGDADAIATGEIIFFAGATITAGNTGTFYQYGTFLRNDAWNWTKGGNIYLSTTGTTGNTMTQTKPTGSNDVVIVLGKATATNIIYTINLNTATVE
jgi:predicted RecA/RadA family phage recombinase